MNPIVNAVIWNFQNSYSKWDMLLKWPNIAGYPMIRTCLRFSRLGE